MTTPILVKNMSENKHINLTVDCIVFNNQGELLTITRGVEPFLGKYALPGGGVEYGETTEKAALRELQEETGVKATSLKLVGVYSDPSRDPRGHIISVAYLVGFPLGSSIQAGDDAASAKFIKDWQNLDFAFDHKQILEDAQKLL